MAEQRLFFVVEGQTEEIFVDHLLKPYLDLQGFGGSVKPIKSKQTGGGLTKYSDVSKQLKNLICESGAIVTTLFDFYKLPHSFPGSTGTQSGDHYEQVLAIEQAMLEDMRSELRRDCRNYVPHVQLHEMETLIFSDVRGLDDVFDPERNRAYKEVRDLIQRTDNPETINNGEMTAPSKRLLKIEGYNKLLHGKRALEVIGVETMRARCPHFGEWLDHLTELLVGDRR